jgi:hypothetical protein
LDTSNRIFLFGSNRQGRHGKGAALTALREYGAIYGQPEGLQGRAYGIITKELRSNYPPVTLAEVSAGVARFLDFARSRADLTFQVTKIGCGLAGFTEDQIRPLFADVPDNVILPEDWR